MKEFAIYTAIVGEYDSIPQPNCVDDRFDYVLFTDSSEETKIGVWQVRRIDYENNNIVKIARYVKANPHLLLPNYKATLWIDASIVIQSSYIYTKISEFYHSNVLIAALKHHQRDCIYDELFEVMACEYEEEYIALDWGRELRKHNYPKNNGLCETGILYRLNDKRIRTFNELWWSYIEKYSKRDQLSFNYSLWEMDVEVNYVLPPNVLLRNCDMFKLIDHNKAHTTLTKKNWIMSYYLKHPNDKQKIADFYYRIYRSCFSHLWAFIYGYALRIKSYIERTLKIKR